MPWLTLLAASCMVCVASAQLQREHLRECCGGIITVLLLHLAAFCRNEYDMRGQYCYRLYLIAEDFSGANRSCVRDGANLLSIDDQEEDTFIRNTYIGPNSTADQFWIGLNDINTEGIFRCVCQAWTCCVVQKAHKPGRICLNFTSLTFMQVVKPECKPAYLCQLGRWQSCRYQH